ncbi:MAG: nucleotidyl transferase AbiEii/AbiGii toxin family protein [Myxococcota bacterium]
MIPQPWIEAWRAEAPWASAALVEQDLVLSRAIVEIFRVPELAAALAFRGGTALHKVHLRPGARYSEDIDLVQAVPAPIGPTFDRVRSVLDPWLGTPKRDLKEGRVNLIYRFTSQEDPPRQLRLKIEINSREQFAVFGHTKVPFEVRSDWFTGSAELTTFHLDELMGTKLRALYQRKKGRDLFDMAMALDHGADPERIVACFSRYMTEGGHHVTRAQFEQNLHEKRARDVFRGDLEPLLRLGSAWDPESALTRVLAELVARLPGDPWAGA